MSFFIFINLNLCVETVSLSQVSGHSAASTQPGICLQACLSRRGQTWGHDLALWSRSHCWLYLLHPKTHMSFSSKTWAELFHVKFGIKLWFKGWHIWVLFVAGEKFPGEGLKLTGYLSLLPEDMLWSMNGLPNQIFPSDHLSLLARFQLDLNIS